MEKQPTTEPCDNFDPSDFTTGTLTQSVDGAIELAPEHCCVRGQISLSHLAKEKEGGLKPPDLLVGRSSNLETSLPLFPEFASLVSSAYKSVREQVNYDTAPEHTYFAPEQTHWVEKYWVKRGNKKYDYYRYCWMEGRKIRRIHIGSVNNTRASQKKEAVELAIREGESPQQIKQIIIASG